MRAYEIKLKEEAKKLSGRAPNVKSGTVHWSSPSNIAIVKYWGKYSGQIPANSSLSMTLKEASTKTKIDFEWKEKQKDSTLNYLFEGEPNKEFSRRIEKYIKEVASYLPWLKHLDLKIDSSNNFPHSSGIASSASALSAMALGLCEIENILFENKTKEYCSRKTSYLARMGSGSAARSVYGGMSLWGKTASWRGSSEEYAIPVKEVHETFQGMKDSILIIESGTKEISSTMGHHLMKSNPYSKVRFDAAEEHMHRLAVVLAYGDMGQFIDIMENEALSLHAMMMTSMPGYILMKPNTLEAIQRIRYYRRRTGLSLGFTLDAGSNVHVIYPKSQADSIKLFIDQELKELCEKGSIIHDEMGDGPVKI